jgi:DNA-binding XRE family transcriptional regulator
MDVIYKCNLQEVRKGLKSRVNPNKILTQREMARDIRISRPHLSDIENGTTPDVKLAGVIKEYLRLYGVEEYVINDIFFVKVVSW